MNRILLALLGARVIKVITTADRDAEVRLLDPPQHLLIESVAERPQFPRRRIRISIFGFEVLNNFRIRLPSQPEIVVSDRFTMPDFAVFDAAGNRRGYGG